MRMCFAYFGALAMIAAPFVAQAATVTIDVRDASGKSMPDSVVMIDSPKKSAGPIKFPWPLVMAQQNIMFMPHVLIVPVGASVAFPNRDRVRHHVYSFSPAKTFELKLYSGNHASDVVFDKPGIATLGCNIHDWMLGYIVVVDTPYFTKTDSEGRATLADLPEGDYELRVWHSRLESSREFISENLKLGGAPVKRSFNVSLRSADQPNHPPEGLEVGLDARASEHAN